MLTTKKEVGIMKVSLQIDVEIPSNISFYKLVLEVAKISKELLAMILMAVQNQLVKEMCGNKYSRNSKYLFAGTKNRTFKTSLGKVKVKLQKLRKRGEKKRFSPLEVLLKIEKRKQNTNDLILASVRQALEQSYRKSIASTKDMLSIAISKSSLWRFVQATKMSISKPKENIDVVFADDTVAKSQDGKEILFRHVIGLNLRKMQYFLLKTAVNESWESIAKSVSGFTDISKVYLISDADRGIINAFKGYVKDNQICILHVINYISYSLWSQDASKNYRKKVKRKLQQLLFTLANSAKKNAGTERLGVRLGETRKELLELAEDLKKKKFDMAADFITLHIDEITTFARAAEEGIKVPYTNNREEREMREFAYRAKRIGARWSVNGLQNLSSKKFIRRFDKESFINFENNLIGDGEIKFAIHPLGA